MVTELTIVVLAVIALFLLWKLLLRVIVLVLIVGILVLVLIDQPELSGHLWDLVSGAVELAVEYGASVVDKLG